MKRIFSEIGSWFLRWFGILIFVLGYFITKAGAIISGEPRLEILVTDFRQDLDES